VAFSKAENPARSLTDDGIADVRRIAGVAAGYGVRVARIVHSGKTRARQTAELMAEALEPPEGVEAMDGLAPMDDVAAFADSIQGRGNVMVVGHLPFLSRLASHLVTGRAEKPIFQFQNGGIVCLTRMPETGAWVIKWALMPDVS